MYKKYIRRSKAAHAPYAKKVSKARTQRRRRNRRNRRRRRWKKFWLTLPKRFNTFSKWCLNVLICIAFYIVLRITIPLVLNDDIDGMKELLRDTNIVYIHEAPVHSSELSHIV